MQMESCHMRGKISVAILLFAVSMPDCAEAQSWIQLALPAPLPSPRGQDTAVYNPFSNRMIVYGGGTNPTLGDVWVLTGANGLGGTSTWFAPSPSGSLPPARRVHTSV